jgi:hypothetical protein
MSDMGLMEDSYAVSPHKGELNQQMNTATISPL